MSQFENVTIIKKSNVYFDGQVSSRTVLFADGSRKTLGLMNPGQYTFGTDAAEIMEILAGEVEVKLPGSADWQAFSAGQTFNVPANSSFDINVKSLTDYCCSYLSE